MKKNFEYFYDFGKVTASNQYNKNKKKNINFKLIRNKFDGTLKFKNKIEFSKIKPTDKIFFNEPDFHLETLASYLKDLTFNKVVGMTYKDFPLVDLVIGKKNFSNKFKISISKMLNLNLKESPETVLEKFTKCTSKLEKKEKSLWKKQRKNSLSSSLLCIDKQWKNSKPTFIYVHLLTLEEKVKQIRKK